MNVVKTQKKNKSNDKLFKFKTLLRFTQGTTILHLFSFSWYVYVPVKCGSMNRTWGFQNGGSCWETSGLSPVSQVAPGKLLKFAWFVE